MKRQVVNPYLPGDVYIPDGEPHLFGDRVYVYGSNDRFGAPMFCLNDYVCWSAPKTDLSAWRYEGVIYKKNQDPKNKLGIRLLFAPDVTLGLDGRYYLYYAFDFMGIMGVAVCDTPCGKFEFYGHIKHANGSTWGRQKGDSFPFDPAIFIDDDQRIYLYSGFSQAIPRFATGFKRLQTEGGYVLELAQDMVTIKQSEKLVFPKEGPDAFLHHEFFEASSLRKYNDKYYFVYSSRHNHELCYAWSNFPTKDFQFGGTLVSIGDVGLTDKQRGATNYLGNTHGGLLEVAGEYYIFYHRQTNRSSYARQACAEKIKMNLDGRFQQTELTSCGLNGGPLVGQGKYDARIACNLWSKTGTARYDGKNPRKKLAKHPYFTQEKLKKADKPRQYIANMQDGAVAGFKYFQFKSLASIQATVRGKGKGQLIVSRDPQQIDIIATLSIETNAQVWRTYSTAAKVADGQSALFFRFAGEGYLDFLDFELV